MTNETTTDESRHAVGGSALQAVVGRTALDEACYANEEAEQELALLRADAARYRWLRGDGGPSSVRWPRWNIQHWTGFWNPVQGAEMDAAVDAAMRYDAPPNATNKPRRRHSANESQRFPASA